MIAEWEEARHSAFGIDVKHPHDRLVLIVLANFRGEYFLRNRNLADDTLLTEKQLRASFERLRKRGSVVGDVDCFEVDGAIPALPERIHAAAPKVTWWTKTRERVFNRDNFRCVYCGTWGTLESLHCDHVVPRSRGGNDLDENLATSCMPCNVSKGNRTPEEWRGV